MPLNNFVSYFDATAVSLYEKYAKETFYKVITKTEETKITIDVPSL